MLAKVWYHGMVGFVYELRIGTMEALLRVLAKVWYHGQVCFVFELRIGTMERLALCIS